MRLGPYTEELKRLELEKQALAFLAQAFAETRNRPTRLIRGIASSGGPIVDEGDVRDYTIDVKSVTFNLPVPLLLAHDWAQLPIGRVIGLEVRGGSLRFRAEIINARWTDPTWERIVNGQLSGVSLTAQGSIAQNKLRHSILREVSLVERAGDLGARLTKCSTRSRVVSLREPQEQVHWSVEA